MCRSEICTRRSPASAGGRLGMRTGTSLMRTPASADRTPTAESPATTPPTPTARARASRTRRAGSAGASGKASLRATQASARPASASPRNAESKKTTPIQRNAIQTIGPGAPRVRERTRVAGSTSAMVAMSELASRAVPAGNCGSRTRRAHT